MVDQDAPVRGDGSFCGVGIIQDKGLGVDVWVGVEDAAVGDKRDRLALDEPGLITWIPPSVPT